MDAFKFTQFLTPGRFIQNGVVLTGLPFVLAAITASLIIAATRWLQRHVGIHENLLHRRYKYTRLKSSRREFRLCQLEPGSFGDIIKAKLSHYPFGEHEHPAYDALSYVWGDPKSRRPVFINGQLSSLAVNLHDALQHVRNENSPTTLWIDAICINQDDLNERSQQIRIMKSIFEGAESVIAWIGPTSHDSDIAMEYIDKFALSTPLSSALHATSERPESLIQNSVQDLFRRPYWERVWIIQELASARRCRVQCGHVCVPLHAFHVLIDALNSNLNIQKYMSVAKATRLLKLSRLCHGQTPHKQSLIDLLWCTVDFQATDPRDKVYAILGIAQEQDRVGIVPEYIPENTLTNSLRKLVKHHIVTENNFDILCYFPTFVCQQSSHHCSWVPDLYRHVNGLCTQSFKASGDRPPVVQFSMSLELLTAKGLDIGKVDTVIGPFELGLSPGSHSENFVFCNLSDDRSFNAMKVAARNALRKIHPGADEQRLDEILWNHIIGDNIKIGGDPPDAPCPCGHLELLEALSARAYDTELPEAYGKITSRYCESDGGKQCLADNDEANILALCPASNLSTFMRLSNRSFFIMTNGMVGLGPPNLQKGDLVSVIFGCSLPTVLRESGEHYEWVGPAYVYRAMNGEYVNGLKDNSPQIRDFMLR